MDKQQDLDIVNVYMKEIARYKLLTKEEEEYLFKNLNVGDNRNKIINANLRLVISIAKKYIGKTKLDFTDLIQEGNTGLLVAIDKFDIKKGNKFSTYATYWIKQYISRALSNTGRTIRIPSYMHENVRKVNNAISVITNELHEDVTEERVSEITKIPLKTVHNTMNLISDSGSLDVTISDDDYSTLGDIVEDKSVQDFVHVFDEEIAKQNVEYILSMLTPIESEILKRRLGLMGYKSKTLIETGKELGYSRERIRQLEKQAINKLQNPIRLKKIYELIN